MKLYDLQVHTDASPCSRISPEKLVEGAVDAGLDGIAVTDHDTIKNVKFVEQAAPPSLDIIPAAEITTTQGHLLALGISEVPPQTDPISVIEHVHDQGGVAVLSHPFDTFRQYYNQDLEEIAAHVDGVETCNSRCIMPRFNREAKQFAEEYDLAQTGGSDGHFQLELGRAYTLCQGDPLDAIRNGDCAPRGRGSYLSGHIATKVHQSLTRVGI
ncbi:PHP domain-containing protein [Haloarchaeobius sp. HME9146]|uniref:PHP domain-containing protein n=1 Tax=Haloarchaeobius sp. HME9146 TaxID=2978732 RepID=UPI0021BE2508|nr:PHP domain-containing protein [Haloarchaeobius sp. HME9146]MCT9097026.1 PHP domain-containing protein [Haloarchaeobius sp. HME9146]